MNNNKIKVKLEDVAKKANVSVSTVSRVINNGSVAKSTREKVEKVIKEINYSPNKIARSLREGKTNTIGFIIPDITNPFFTQIINELEKTSRGKEYSIIVSNTYNDPEIEKRKINSLLGRRVDGLFVTSSDKKFAKLYENINKEYPVILIDRIISKKIDSIRTDNINSTMQAITQLINNGKRKIATIAGPQEYTPGEERYRGYIETLKLFNLPIQNELIKIGDFTKESGYKLTEELINSNKDFDAIFAANNFMGVGAFKALKDNDYKIPEEVSLIMFDDLELADVADPSISAIIQSTKEIGRYAKELIIDRIEKKGKTDPKEILIPSTLEVRKSI